MRILRKGFRIIIKAILCLVTLVLFGCSLFYINTTIYDFPEQKAFSGEHLFNPYKNLPDSSYRANFHAHSIAWEKVTNGHNTEKDLFDGYTEKGYDIVGISNYHKISDYAKSRTDLYVPVYEHGYNIFKSHYLAINSPKVSSFDYPLYQLASHKQKIIHNIQENGALIAMAHPKFAGGRSFSDMENLVGYNFTEVLNHYRISDIYWDKALSAGHLTWVMGNDDTHDLVKEATFRIWNIIHSETRNSDSIMQSMADGKSYAIWSLNQECDNLLSNCEINNQTIDIKFEKIADSILTIGQNGEILQKTYQSDSSCYMVKETDTYIRTVAYNANSHIYLNPIIRFDGIAPPLSANVKVESNFILTWLFRICMVLISLALLYSTRRIIRF